MAAFQMKTQSLNEVKTMLKFMTICNPGSLLTTCALLLGRCFVLLENSHFQISNDY